MLSAKSRKFPDWIRACFQENEHFPNRHYTEISYVVEVQNGPFSRFENPGWSSKKQGLCSALNKQPSHFALEKPGWTSRKLGHPFFFLLL